MLDSSDLRPIRDLLREQIKTQQRTNEILEYIIEQLDTAKDRQILTNELLNMVIGAEMETKILCDNPDCKCCSEPTKRYVGRTIDAEGPGVVSKLYACDNQECRDKKKAQGDFQVWAVDHLLGKE